MRVGRNGQIRAMEHGRALVAALVIICGGYLAVLFPLAASAGASLHKRHAPRMQDSIERGGAASTCFRKRVRILLPARWVTVHENGRRIRVKLPARSRMVTVVECHRPRHCLKKREQIHIPPRWVTVQEPGRRIRVELPPWTRIVTVVVCHKGSGCIKKHERIRVPPRWVTVQEPGRRIRVRLPGQTRVVTVVECPATSSSGSGSS